MREREREREREKERVTMRARLPKRPKPAMVASTNLGKLPPENISVTDFTAFCTG